LASRGHDDRPRQDGVKTSDQHCCHRGDDGWCYRHETDERHHFGYADGYFQPNVKNSGDHHEVIVLLIDSYIGY
jgi:hypothetical protein